MPIAQPFEILNDKPNLHFAVSTRMLSKSIARTGDANFPCFIIHAQTCKPYMPLAFNAAKSGIRAFKPHSTNRRRLRSVAR
jgi:hypothetical protein